MPGESSHKDLWNWMGRNALPIFQTRGSDYARVDRVIADYGFKNGTAHPFTPAFFDEAWANMENLHKLMDAMPATFPIDPILSKADKGRLTTEAKKLWPPAK